MVNRPKWMSMVAALAVVAVPAAGQAASGGPILGQAPMSKPQLRVLETALLSLDGQTTHRMSVEGTIGVTYRQPQSRMSVSMSDDFAALIQVAGPTRASMSLVDGAIGPVMSAISYDGTGFAGTVVDPYVQLSKSDSASMNLWFEPRHQQIRPRDLTYLSDIRELPTEGSDAGLLHFRAELSPNYTRSLVRAIVVDPASSSTNNLATALEYTPGILDVFITPDGKLVRESIDTKATVRPGQTGLIERLFGRRVGSGMVWVKATFTPTDLGATVQIVRPYVPKRDPGTSDDFMALGLLMGAGEAADTYATVTGNYAGLTIKTLRRIEPEIVWVKKRPARSARFEVRLKSVSANRIVLSTRTPSLREFIMQQPLSGDVTILCRTRAGKPCRISIFAKIANRITSHTAEAARRR